MKIKSLAFLLCVSIIFQSASCKKKEPVIPIPLVRDIHVKVSHSFDGVVLEADTIKYMIASGSPISVHRLQYYMSGFKLYKDNGEVVERADVVYIDFKDEATNAFILKNIPTGNYTGISFCVGLDSAQNLTGALPDNYNNINMAWPGVMGGGYHFMKLEGQFTDYKPHGYAVHLGRNKNLVHVNTLAIDLRVISSNPELALDMNVAEWFKNPYTYDFNIDGNYTMSDMEAMMKIAMNGKDVFTIK